MEATSSRNLSSLEEGEEGEKGGEGGQLPAGSGGNNPNNNTEHENENTKAATTAVPSSSSTGKDAPLSSSLVSSFSASTVGILTENGPCHNNTNDAAAAAATTPSPSSATKTMSEVVAAELAAAESRCGREECPICFHVLPPLVEIVYQTCCGRKICSGCIIGRDRAELKEAGKIIDGVTPEDTQFIRIHQHWSNVCPFCRHTGAETDEEQIQFLYDRIQKRHDRDYTTALNQLGVVHSRGRYGLPQNIEKAEEFFQEAYDLDDPDAANYLYRLYLRHHPDQKEKQMEFLRRGEALGDLICIQMLAALALSAALPNLPKNGKEVARLLMKAVSLGGNDINKDMLMIFYRHEFLSKKDLATTLRAHQATIDEIKTVQREFAKRYKAFDERN